MFIAIEFLMQTEKLLRITKNVVKTNRKSKDIICKLSIHLYLLHFTMHT